MIIKIISLVRHFLIKLYLSFSARIVGKDDFGNIYYLSYHLDKNRNVFKRYCLYKGRAEPSKVPPTWHAWLHYIKDTVPANESYKPYEWSKTHLPNLTGTAYAYVPKNHPRNLAVSEGYELDEEYTATYSKWSPKSLKK